MTKGARPMNTTNGRKWKKLSGGEQCWNPQTPGDSKEFTQYLRFVASEKPGTSGKHYFLSGNEEVWLFDSKMLSDQLSEALIGLPVKIVFQGKKQAKSGATYKHFDVYAEE